MRIALAQVASTTDPAANLDLIRDHARRAAEGGAVVVVFPEATMCSFARPAREVAEPFDGPWATAVREIARDLGISIAVGMFTTSHDGRVHNTVLVTGHTEGRYDKIHLFDAMGYTESKHIAPGREPVIVRAGHYGVGLTVCYDIRFPGLYAALARSGAHAILVAASWAPGPQKVHQWRSAAIARAMDSTCFVIAIDQAAVGDVDEPGLPTGVGHSMVVDPTGNVLVELGEAPELAFVDFTPDDVNHVREQIPVLRNARY
jgi:predicted amidohydrolase